MTNSSVFRDLFRQMEWADALVWSVVLKHSVLLEDDTLRDRLYHLHLVQRAFLHIWRGETLAFQGTEQLRGNHLAAWGRAYHASVAPFVESLIDAHLDTTVNLPWASEVMARLGTKVPAPSLAETLVQVPMHSAYHRGQVNSRIRELGPVPPLTDFIAWVWSDKPVPAWPDESE